MSQKRLAWLTPRHAVEEHHWADAGLRIQAVCAAAMGHAERAHASQTLADAALLHAMTLFAKELHGATITRLRGLKRGLNIR